MLLEVKRTGQTEVALALLAPAHRQGSGQRRETKEDRRENLVRGRGRPRRQRHVDAREALERQVQEARRRRRSADPLAPADPERKEPETHSWHIFQDALWNEDKHLGWRFTAAELQKRSAAAQPAPKRRR